MKSVNLSVKAKAESVMYMLRFCFCIIQRHVINVNRTMKIKPS